MDHLNCIKCYLMVCCLILEKYVDDNHFTQQTFIGLQDMSWRHLQNVFRVTIFCLLRHFEDVLEDKKLLRWRVFKTSSRCVFKTPSRHVFKTSWRQTKCLLGISVSKKSKSVSGKSISHISISDKSRRIQNGLISTQ